MKENDPSPSRPLSEGKEDAYLPTRVTLLSRLRDWADRESWQEFFETYWQLIYATAKRSGLKEPEAQDVVQDVFVAASKSLPNFRYDPSRGSFKGWLVDITKKKIANQFNKRPPWRRQGGGSGKGDEDVVELDEICGIDEQAINAYWDQEWQRTMVEAAMRRAKARVSPRQFQIFELYVCQDHTVREVCAALRVSPVQVYLAKNRVAKKIKEEVARLEKETGEAAEP